MGAHATRPARARCLPFFGTLGRSKGQSVSSKSFIFVFYTSGDGSQGCRHNASQMFTTELLSPVVLSLQRGGREQSVWRKPLPVALGLSLLGGCGQ